MEGYSNKGRTKDVNSKFKQEIHSKVIRAGKRTYFFDVKSTRNEELYLTITESKKKFESEGKFYYEKHKVFLYKEDFQKFIDSLRDVIDYIRDKQPDEYIEENEEEAVAVLEEEDAKDGFTDVEFEDLSS
ncbi:MAG: DUF3276 family protein [Mariniphaga sp.]|nr:DUF3276 family protein [Mariniphaga sp.]